MWLVEGPQLRHKLLGSSNIPQGGAASPREIRGYLTCTRILYNWLIWRVLKLAFFFKKVFSLYLFWRLEQSEQRHLHVDIFLCDL